MTGFEPVASSLPRKRSTPELHRLIFIDQFNSATRSFIGHYLLLHFRYLEVFITKHLLIPLERETGFKPATLSLEG
jgi:hypothetical protein